MNISMAFPMERPFLLEDVVDSEQSLNQLELGELKERLNTALKLVSDLVDTIEAVEEENRELKKKMDSLRYQNQALQNRIRELETPKN